MQNASNMTFRNLFGSGEGFNWALVAQTDPVGNMVGKLLRGEPLSPETKQAIDDNKTNSQQDSKKAEGFFGFLDKLDESIGGIFLSMKNGLGGFAGSLGHEFTGLVSTLGNAVGAGWDSLTALGSEFIEKAGNWIGGSGFSTDMEIIDAEARAIEERRSNAFMSRLDEIQSKGTKNLYDVNYYLANAMGLKPGESMNHLAETLGYENSQKLKEAFTKGEVKLSELVDASGINTSGDIAQFAQDFAFVSQAREQKNAAARLAREYRESALDNARETDYDLRQQELGTHSEAEQIYNQNQFNEASGLNTAKRILSSFQGLFGSSGGNEERSNDENSSLIHNLNDSNYEAIYDNGLNSLRDFINSNPDLAQKNLMASMQNGNFSGNPDAVLTIVNIVEKNIAKGMAGYEMITYEQGDIKLQFEVGEKEGNSKTLWDKVRWRESKNEPYEQPTAEGEGWIGFPSVGRIKRFTQFFGGEDKLSNFLNEKERKVSDMFYLNALRHKEQAVFFHPKLGSEGCGVFGYKQGKALYVHMLNMIARGNKIRYRFRTIDRRSIRDRKYRPLTW